MQLQWWVLAVLLLTLNADHFLIWPAFLRRVQIEGAKARRSLWTRWMLMLWTNSALVLWLWVHGGVSMPSVGLAWPEGWRLWLPLGLGGTFFALQASASIKIARLTVPSPKLREQLGSTAVVMPHSRTELPVWFAVSLTAGFCEELLFRGFLVWLLRPMVGTWAAAALAVVAFALGHAYQGRRGILHTGLAGIIFTAVVLVTGSLWVAITLHAALDIMSGLIGWLILRERSQLGITEAATPAL